MAESCDKIAENEMKNAPKDEVNAAANDDDLDALLDDALKDFTKEDILHPAAKGKAKAQDNIDDQSSNPTSKGNEPSHGNDNMESLLSEDNFSKMAEEFSKAFQNIPAEDLKALKNLSGQAAGVPVGTESSGQSLEDNLESAWSSLAQNLKDMKEENPDNGLDEDMLQAMKGMGLDGADGGPEGFVSMMQGMMTNLLSKDILYPSLKEIQTRYPPWLEEQQSTLSKEDLDRYKQQEDLVARICIEFESEKENDSDEIKNKRVEKIMHLMHQMQACGQPPFDLLEQTEEGNSAQPRPNIPNPEECSVM